MKKFIERVKSSLVVYLFFISVFFGLLYFLINKPDLSSSINILIDSIKNNNQNIILLNIGIISFLFLSSIVIIPFPFVYLYIFLEGFSIGFTFGLFIINKGINGLLFYIVFLLLCKFIYIILLLYFSIMCNKYIKNIIDNIIRKNREGVYNAIINNIYRYIIVITLITINSIFIYFYSNKLLLHLIPLIK